jgi:two-component system chemotaxis response regulator CheB
MSERAIVIGTSAGGVQALSRILPRLPEALSMPILVVVHVPPRKPNALVELFAKKCPLPVKEAEDKEPLANGIIYHSRPAIDALFETAADAFGPGLTGIVLTGANHDGAAGLKAVGLAGGTAIVEDPASAEVPIMPAAALAACPTAEVMTLDQISNFLKETAAQ